MNSTCKHILVSGVVALIVSLIVVGLNDTKQDSVEELRKHYYLSQVATLESPHGLRKKIMHGNEDFVLVDVRSAQEYEEEHFVGAVNIPIYTDPDTSAYDDVERVVNSFRDLQEQYPFRKIIVYCYSSSCMSGRKVGKILAENDVFVKEMTVGWNELRYDWNMWNYPHEWDNTNVMDYMATGTDPGVFKNVDTSKPEGCGISDAFGC